MQNKGKRTESKIQLKRDVKLTLHMTRACPKKTIRTHPTPRSTFQEKKKDKKKSNIRTTLIKHTYRNRNLGKSPSSRHEATTNHDVDDNTTSTNINQQTQSHSVLHIQLGTISTYILHPRAPNPTHQTLLTVCMYPLKRKKTSLPSNHYHHLLSLQSPKVDRYGACFRTHPICKRCCILCMGMYVI